MRYNPKIVAAYLVDCGLPEPVFEYRFHPVRKWRFDIAFPANQGEGGLAVECEGGVHIGGRHTRISGFKKDMEKYNEATRRGWRILRFIPQEICMHETVQLIKECLKGEK